MPTDPHTFMQLAGLRHAELIRSATDHRRGLVHRRAARPTRSDPAPSAVVETAPAMLAVLPLGMAVGVAIHDAAVAAGPGLATSALMFGGGAANLVAVELTGSGAAALVVLGAVAIVNARLALYAAALESRFRHQPGWFRWLAPHMIVDQTYALAAGRADLHDPAHFRRWWLSAGAVLGLGWCAAVGAGIALGRVLPADSPLAIAAPACLVAMLVPRLVDRPVPQPRACRRWSRWSSRSCRTMRACWSPRAPGSWWRARSAGGWTSECRARPRRGRCRELAAARPVHHDRPATPLCSRLAIALQSGPRTVTARRSPDRRRDSGVSR